MARSLATFVLLAILVDWHAVRAGQTVPPGSPEPASAPPALRSTAIGLSVGANSMVGLLGPTLTRAFGRHFQLEVGAGLGFWGWQLSLMPKVSFGTERDRYVGGVGVSVTVPPRHDECCDASPIWLVVDAIGYEHRFDSGLALGFALGPVLGLGGGRICDYFEGCLDSDFHDVAGVWKGQARFELAYWF
jgi:hypothetical protein